MLFTHLFGIDEIARSTKLLGLARDSEEDGHDSEEVEAVGHHGC